MSAAKSSSKRIPPEQLPLNVRFRGCCAYEPIWQEMRQFTDMRTRDINDDLWVLEHQPVFTQGQAGKPEHVLHLDPTIPLVQSDRGGQVTYHGPGQLIAYPLIDIKRRGMGVRELVTCIENSVVDFLACYGIEAAAKPDAPGVYVDGRKIASLGLRVRKGCSFHGVSINFSMDLKPFLSINPCGYAGLEMVQFRDLVAPDQLPSFESFQQKYARMLALALGYVEPNIVMHSTSPLQINALEAP